MKRTILKKENGIVRIVDTNVEAVEQFIKETSNPCFECKYGYANKCPKISDEFKKNILEYDYITDGYQVYNENCDVESLVITNCTKFEKEPVRIKAKTKQEITELKALKESLKILYFGGIDIHEANTIQRDIKRRELMKQKQLIKTNKHGK